MYRCKLNYSCYFAVLWTIAQAVLHSYVCLVSVMMHFCQFMPTQLHLFYYIYFTFLYHRRCPRNLYIDFGDPNLVYPVDANLAASSDFILKSYLTLDGLLVVTSVALLCGVFFRIKQGWAVVYYSPWLIAMGLSIALDVLCLIKFAPQLLNSMSTRSWLEYVGFEKIPKEIGTEFDPRFFQANLYAVLFFARFGSLFVNVLLFGKVMKSMRDAYEETDRNGRQRYKTQRRSAGNNNASPNPIDHSLAEENAEERIRRWQEFYGDVESQESYQMEVIVKENDGEGKKSDLDQLKCNMPFSYTDNLQDIAKIRNRLTTTAANNNDQKLASLSDEAETTF